MKSSICALFPLTTALLLAASVVRGGEVSEGDRRIVQTVQRLASFDYQKATPKTREAIERYLAATAGSEEYFTLVEKFAVTGQNPTLLSLATAQTGTPKAAAALKLLLKQGGQPLLDQALQTLKPEAAGDLLASAADVGTQEAVSLAWSGVIRSDIPVSVQSRIVSALGRSAAGQQVLLKETREGRLPEGVRETAATALTTSTDETVRQEAAGLFTMAVKKELPPPAELAKRTGDAVKGQTVFMTYCFTCHQVKGQGIDFGPALSEIGSKLAKEALYDSIINPGAGISFGYEGFEVRTKRGETFIGMIASETADEISLRVPGGVIQKIALPEVASKTPLGVSLMTPGLHQVMEEAQLVDLIEYLAGLKKEG